MFIAADVNKRALKRKQSQLQFTQMIVSNQRESITSKMNGLQSSFDSKNKDIQNWNRLSDKDQQTQINNNSALYQKMCTYLGSSFSSPRDLNEFSVQNDAAYIYYQAQDVRLDSQNDSIESQLTLLNAEIENYDKLVQNNISKDTNMWAVTGG